MKTPSDIAKEIVPELLRNTKVSLGECWILQKHVAANGYGQVQIKGKTYKAHRLVCMFYNPTVDPTGLDTIHSCDVPACVNPKHLSFGTRAKNVKEAYDRGLMKPRRGADNSEAKLTWEQAEEIRKLRKEGLEHLELAKKYGVSRATVGRIVRNESWIK